MAIRSGESPSGRHSAREHALRLLCAAWIGIVWPIFGLMPVLYATFGRNLNNEVTWIWFAAASSLLSVFIGGSPATSEHEPPPLTLFGWIVITIMTNAVAVLGVRKLRRLQSEAA